MHTANGFFRSRYFCITKTTRGRLPCAKGGPKIVAAFVAHRLSTIRNADRIIVMDDGKLVEMGTYEELVALNGKFAELDRLCRIREMEMSEV